MVAAASFPPPVSDKTQESPVIPGDIELTYEEIGERLGMHPERVRAIERRALRKLAVVARRIEI